jgi:prepilin-type N-terminal cleavage/methylation domain-containing protein
MFRHLKNQKGFSLIELLVVVVIIAILAAIAVPIYMSYVKKARATEAQSAIAALRSAYRIYFQTYGSTENYTIDDAMLDAKLGKATEKNWEFEVVGNPPKKYVATSTADFPQGEGKQVWYDVDEAMYHGYGIDPEEEGEDEEVID